MKKLKHISTYNKKYLIYLSLKNSLEISSLALQAESRVRYFPEIATTLQSANQNSRHSIQQLNNIKVVLVNKNWLFVIKNSTYKSLSITHNSKMLKRKFLIFLKIIFLKFLNSYLLL